MKWDLFKNKLKKEAQQQNDAVDIDALWSAIEPDVDALNGAEKKRRRFFLWFFFGAAVALTGTWFALSNDDAITTGMVAENNFNENKNENPPAVQGEVKNENEVLNLSDYENKNEALADDLNQKKEIPGNENTISGWSEEKIAINENKRKNNSIKNSSLNSEESSNDLTENANDISLIKIKNNSKINPRTNTQRALKDAALFLQKENITILSEKKTPIRKANIEENKVAISNEKAINRININSLLENWKNESLPTKGDSLSEPAKFIASRDYFADDKKTKQSKISFTAGVTGGISFANRNLSQKEGPESLIFQYRNQYESPMEASHYGFFIGAKHEKYNLGLTIGLQNTTLTERYSYKSVIESTETITGVQVRRVNLDGDTINVMGDILETTTATVDKNIYNSYRLLEIPVTLSYHFPFRKWNLGLEAGILANLSLKTKGIVPNELLEVPSAMMMRDQDIDNSKNDLFKTKIGLGYQFGLSAGGTVVGNLEWRVAPMLRIYPSDFAGADNELSQRYVLYGVNVGFGYRF